MLEDLFNLDWGDRHDLFCAVQKVYNLANYKDMLGCSDFADVCGFQNDIMNKYKVSEGTFNDVYDLYREKPNMNALRVELYFINKYHNEK